MTVMANKKKRNKKYQGVDAVQTPGLIKVTAPNRSKAGQWFHDNRQRVAVRLLQIGLVLIIGGVIYLIFF